MEAALELLHRAFNALGFSVQPKDLNTFYAQRADGSYLVRFTGNPSLTDVEQVRTALPSGWGGILATTANGDDDLRRAARQAGVYLWDHEEVERQIGRALLYETTTGPAAPTVETAPAATPAQETYNSLGAFFGGPGAASLPLTAPAGEWANVTSKPTAASSQPPALTSTVFTPPASAAEPRTLALFSFPLAVQPYDLPTLTHLPPDGLDVSLVFQPLWLLNYRIDHQETYRGEVVDVSGQGSLLLSALDGRTQPNPPVPPQREVVVPGVSYRVKEPTIDRTDALKAALADVTERHTRTVRFKDMKGEAAVVEHRRFAPAPQDVRYSMDLVYQPVWVVHGGGQMVEINATTGEPRRTRPHQEDAEVY